MPRGAIPVVVSTLLAIVSLNSEGAENTTARHCTPGDVTSLLQAFTIGFNYASGFREEIKIAGLGGAIHCQYRVFAPRKPSNGEPWAFCEQDIFLGGIVYMVPYQQLGLSRQYAIEEELEKLDSTVLIGPVDGEQTEQTLLRVANKDYVHPFLGNVVYTQLAFIAQRDPGIYRSTWTGYFMGSPMRSVEVEVEVVTHEEHLHRIDNGTWRTW